MYYFNKGEGIPLDYQSVLDNGSHIVAVNMSIKCLQRKQLFYSQPCEHFNLLLLLLFFVVLIVFLDSP